MDIEPITRYLNTVKKLGYIKNTEIFALAVYAFLSYMVENEDEVGLDNTMKAEINDITFCLLKKNCLLVNIELFDFIVNTSISFLLTAGGTMIKTAKGTPIKLR